MTPVPANTVQVSGTVQAAGELATLISQIVTATGAGDLTSKTADAGTLTTGSNTSGSYTDTASDNDVYWITAPVTPAVGGFGLRQGLQFNLPLNRFPTSFELKGYWNGSGQTVDVYAYNVRTAVYDKLTNTGTSLISRSSETVYSIILPRDYVDDSGGSFGIVLMELRSASTNTGHRMRVDRALVYHISESTNSLMVAPSVNDIWTAPIRTLTTPGVEPTTPPTTVEITAAILAAVYEGSETFQEYLRLSRAVLYGKSIGLNSATPAFRDAADTKDRIAATGLPTSRDVTLDAS